MALFDKTMIYNTKPTKGGKNMYKILSKKEVEEFTKKHLGIWEGDIEVISCIEYDNIREYLINGHYFYTIKN